MNDIQLDIKLINGLRLAYDSPNYSSLFIKALNPITNELYKQKLKPKEPFMVDIHYLTPWKISFERKGKEVANLQISYVGAEVGLRFATSALGDTLAWVPIVEEWIRVNNPSKVYLYTNWNRIFDKSKYSNKIIWLDDAEDFNQVPNLRVFYVVGISRCHEKMLDPRTNHATPTNWKTTNMINTINYAFNVEPVERKPHLQPLEARLPINQKFVTLCPAASQKIKHWLNPKGWMSIIHKLNQLGYKVVVVGNTPNYLPDTIDGVGPDIFQAMAYIKNAEFHIGLSSGLSWVAWAYNKPVLMIGNFTDPGYEFTSNVIRVYKDSNQAGLFNNSSIPWEPIWQYDPFNDNVSLAREITGDHALKGLDKMLEHVTQNKPIETGYSVLEDGTLRPTNVLGLYNNVNK